MDVLLIWEARGTRIVLMRNDTHIFCCRMERGMRLLRMVFFTVEIHMLWPGIVVQAFGAFDFLSEERYLL